MVRACVLSCVRACVRVFIGAMGCLFNNVIYVCMHGCFHAGFLRFSLCGQSELSYGQHF